MSLACHLIDPMCQVCLGVRTDNFGPKYKMPQARENTWSHWQVTSAQEVTLDRDIKDQTALIQR